MDATFTKRSLGTTTGRGKMDDLPFWLSILALAVKKKHKTYEACQLVPYIKDMWRTYFSDLVLNSEYVCKTMSKTV